jgi:hypothetical protein
MQQRSKINLPIEIELGGKTRHFKLDMNAMAVYEWLTGKTIFNQNTEDIGVSDIRALLYALLIHEDPDLTLEQVGSMVDISKLDDISDKLTEAFEAILPGAEKKTVKKGKKIPG